MLTVPVEIEDICKAAKAIQNEMLTAESENLSLLLNLPSVVCISTSILSSNQSMLRLFHMFVFTTAAMVAFSVNRICKPIGNS